MSFFDSYVPEEIMIERERILGIFRAAQPNQSRLVHELVRTGTPLREAMIRLLEDAKSRLYTLDEQAAAEWRGNSAMRKKFKSRKVFVIFFKALKTRRITAETLTI
jgi:hypothetical protein